MTTAVAARSWLDPPPRRSVAALASWVAMVSGCMGEPVVVDLLPPADPEARPEPERCADIKCSMSTPRCDPVSLTCVACLTDADCSGARSVCDVAAGKCVECLIDTDCAGAHPVCDVTAGKCVECSTRADCGDPERGCDPSTKRCVPLCAGSEECKAPAAVCSPELQVCVGCAVDADCTDPKKPLCRAADGRCVSCRDAVDCASGEVCDPTDGQCRRAP